MYSTRKGTLSNVKAKGSACIAFFAYMRSSPDCSVLGQYSSKHGASTILVLQYSHGKESPERHK